MRVAPAPGATAANFAVPLPPPPVPIGGATWKSKVPVLNTALPETNVSWSRVTNNQSRLSVLLQPVTESWPVMLPEFTVSVTIGSACPTTGVAASATLPRRMVAPAAMAAPPRRLANR
jgi:hypothetical protein